MNRNDDINFPVADDARFKEFSRITMDSNGNAVLCNEGEPCLGHLTMDVNADPYGSEYNTSNRSVGRKVAVINRLFGAGEQKAISAEALATGDFFKGANDGKIKKAASLDEAEGMVRDAVSAADRFPRVLYF